VLDLVRAMARGLRVPVFCKIRLCDTPEETLAFCLQLKEAGCALLAVHARFRGTPTRRRDGPAHLEQLAPIKRAVGSLPLLANGNVSSAADVVASLQLTGADGVMSAEGMLDDPSILGKAAVLLRERRRGLRERLRAAKALRAEWRSNPAALSAAEREEVETIKRTRRELKSVPTIKRAASSSTDAKLLAMTRPELALEYLRLASSHDGVPLACMRFHVRRMCREAMAKAAADGAPSYAPLIEVADSPQQLATVARLCAALESGVAPSPADVESLEALRSQAACAKINAAKRAEFEARMRRKARREGKPDDEYITVGLAPPTVADVAAVRALPPAEQIGRWSSRFKQHCCAYHLVGRCERALGEHGCAFLHTTALQVAGESGETPTWLEERSALAP
jgi:tRNA-dihydrouridine synthase 1